MDPARNPFAPGAGTPPPELAGRQAIIDNASIALKRIKLGKPARSQMLLGLRGVGKTVLLNRISDIAEQEGFYPLVLEAPEDRDLATMLVPKLRALLFQLSRSERSAVLAKRGLGILRSFASAFKVTLGDIEVGVAPEIGTGDSGDLETDLPDLLFAIVQAAKETGRAVALFIDEVQYIETQDLSALIVTVHKLGQKNMPFVLFGAGLPQLAALAGDAKSYAERLFEYPGVGPLSDDDARAAIRSPIEHESVRINDDALQAIIRQTQGYPYFLQEWGSHTWNIASTSPITASDVHVAEQKTLEHLDSGFFRVRLDRLTPREKDYIRAMAELGAGPHRSGEIARLLKIGVTVAAPLRNGLIRKGMIFSPSHGDTAFTVPMFDDFMKRSMPQWSAPSSAKARKGKKSSH